MMEKFILYFPLDDPILVDPDLLASIYLRHNVTTIEIAIPVINSPLDGEVIRGSMNRILERHTQEEVLIDVRQLKLKFPLLQIEIMAYQQVIEKIGIDKFISLLLTAQVSYLLCPDAVLTFKGSLMDKLKGSSISLIHFSKLCPTETEIAKLQNATGYIFQRSTNKKTGGVVTISPQLKETVVRIKKVNQKTPVVVGFGITSAMQAKKILAFGANGIVIGSAIFDHIHSGTVDTYLSEFDDL